jgi:hypothetical protein
MARLQWGAADAGTSNRQQAVVAGMLARRESAVIMMPRSDPLATTRVHNTFWPAALAGSWRACYAGRERDLSDGAARRAVYLCRTGVT